MTNEQQNQANNQANNQAHNQNTAQQNNVANNQANNQQVQQMIQQRNEAKTVINGKVVPLQEVQVAEELFNQQNTQTGIQAHHDNSSEAVQTGQVAQSQQGTLAQAMNHLQSANNHLTQMQNVNLANVQSGTQHLEPFMEQAKFEIQEAQQMMQRAMGNVNQQQSQVQQQTQGMPEQLAQHVQDHDAIQTSVNQANAKAKARAKKEQ